MFNKLKIKAKISIPIVLVFGLTFGGGGFGYLSAVHGSHFVVVLEDLTVEKYYSIGNNDYERADGEIYTIEKMNNVLINDSGKELVIEKVVYGYNDEPDYNIIDVFGVQKIKVLPSSIYFFDDTPPERVSSKDGKGQVKYWVYLYE